MNLLDLLFPFFEHNVELSYKIDHLTGTHIVACAFERDFDRRLSPSGKYVLMGRFGETKYWHKITDADRADYQSMKIYNMENNIICN
jgi:hypothetical protein